jgi:OmpA-OmpF porin, OOP family
VNSPQLADARFDLSGYTDASGDKDKNLALSQARAASLKSFLVAQGVADSRLDAHGYGAADFVAAPTSPRNRRVEAKRVQ